MDTENIVEGSISVIIVTHGEFGAGLLRSAELILGPQTDCAALVVDATQDVSATVTRLREMAERVDHGRGVLLLTDMFGGTPTNLCLSLLSVAPGKVEVVTGVNLPMVLRVFGQRHLTLSELANEAKEAGVKGIVVAGDMLRTRAKEKG